jgi:hypothetical protein
MQESQETAGTSPEYSDPKETLIAETLDRVPEDLKGMTAYYLRHLPKHMADAGMTPDEITKKLDEIGFPNLLRPPLNPEQP